MDSLNTLRAVLVAAALLAAIILALNGMWVPAIVLTIGIAAHGLLWLYLWRTGAFDRDEAATPPTF